jgi:hypothetical protein
VKQYIGTKVISARPMTRGDYNLYRGWDIPADENPNDEGYLVEYRDGGHPNHIGHAGYISWSPKDVFQKSYREAGAGLTFGEAVEALKAGHKVTRLGWNGKGMFIYFVGEGRYPPTTPAGLEIANEHKDNRVPYRPYLAMFTAQRDVVPWLASQSDILEEDWVVIL